VPRFTYWKTATVPVVKINKRPNRQIGTHTVLRVTGRQFVFGDQHQLAHQHRKISKTYNLLRASDPGFMLQSNTRYEKKIDLMAT